MKNFVRKSIKGGRCIAFKQQFKSEMADEVFNFFLKELDINGNICETLEKYFEFLNKYEKQYAKKSIQNMMSIELLIKKKKLILLTKHITC